MFKLFVYVQEGYSSFLVMSLFGFAIRITLISSNELKSIPTFLIIWKNLSRISIVSSLSVWWNLPVKSTGPGVFFCGKVFKDSMSLII